MVESLAPSSQPGEVSLPRGRLMLLFGLAAAISIGLGFVSWGQKVLYPFGLFSTWAHEMGHGIGALLTGNRFDRIELFPSLGGQAWIAGADGLSQVFVSALGLLGPAVLGAAVMIAGSRPHVAPRVLAVLAAVVTIATLIWGRNLFGFVSMLLIALALALVAKFGTPTIRVVLAQLLAVQLGLSAWSRRDYLFIDGFERDGFQASDTQKIADELFLPYWFWGGLIGLLSFVILAWAFWVAWLRPLTNQA